MLSKPGKKRGTLDNLLIKAQHPLLGYLKIPEKWLFKNITVRILQHQELLLYIVQHILEITWLKQQSAYGQQGAVLPLPLTQLKDSVRYECPGTHNFM